MQIIDITRPLSGDAVVYPGDRTPVFSQSDRGMYLISDLTMSSHSGTHIDAPVHYLKRGKTIDSVSLTSLIGRCRVLDLCNAGSTITAGDLEGKISNIKRLLLKTTFSGMERFEKDYPCLTIDAAGLITRTGIQCVGIDSPSIETYECDGTVHRELLSHGCIIIELLDLSGVEEGDYEMVALPLRLKGLDGSPARVVLLKKDGDE